MGLDNPNINNEENAFRDSVGTMETTGKRKWVYAKKPSGKFTNYRNYVGYFLLALLLIIPFVTLPNGNPLFKLDVLNREFIIFGFPFFTSDFFLLAIGLISCVIFVVVFTVAYGRIFCGWICPQTIFMELVFRKIEYAIEGDRAKQIRLDKQDWDEEKIRKRALKWTIYAVFSFFMVNILITYITGADALFEMIKNGPMDNIGMFMTIIIVSILFCFVFSWFREQVCTMVCPYGRLQGVLMDKHTVNITYDYKRGEREKGRGRFKKGVDRKAEGIGDCIDCNQCVVVCPTGIDIRNGTQLECVNCTACIDACDEVMTKTNLPTGLIRYASELNIEKEEAFHFTKRMFAYTVVLTLLVFLSSLFLLNRPDIEAKFLRVPGTDYKIKGDYVINEYQYTLYNKTNKTNRVVLKLKSHKGIVELSGPNHLILDKGEIKQGHFSLKIPKEELSSYKEKIVMAIYDEEGNELDEYTSSFAAPFK